MRSALPATLLLAMLLPLSAPADVVINELLPDPSGIDDNNELVEIYNRGPAAVDVTGWAIEDLATINDGTIRRRIPEDFDPAYGSTSAILQPGDFRVVRGTAAAYMNQTGDTIYLTSNRTGNLAAVVYSVNYPAAQFATSWANSPDGAQPANFAWRASTFGASNCAADAVPPAAVSNLAASSGQYAGEVDLSWTAVGDDGLTGQALQHVVKYNTVPITSGNFDASFDAFNEPVPGPPGTAEQVTVFGLDPQLTYWFAIKTRDCHNASAISTTVPSTQPGTTPLPFPDRTVGLQHWYGNLHSHTSYSDGEPTSTPTSAYTYARTLAPAPLDYLAVTDHNHAAGGFAMTPTLYHQGLAQAAAANADGQFVAIYGQEWGLAANGHLNIFEAPVLFGWEPGNNEVFVAEGDYASLYTAIQNNPSPWGALAEFCHPAASDFNSLALTSAGAAVVRAIALVNGPAFSTVTNESDVGNTNFDPQYHTALKNGYFVGTTADQDNHHATWGSSSQSRTVILSTTLSKDSLLAGLAHRRAYASQDHNAELDMRVNGYPMGSRFFAGPGDGVNFDLTVGDSDGEHVQLFELFRGIPGAQIPMLVATADNVDHFVYRDEEQPPPGEGEKRQYYVRVTQQDNQRLWSAPVEVTFSTVVDTRDEYTAAARPGGRLYPAQPNPFNPRTEIRFALSGAGVRPVRLRIFDARGRHVRTLVDSRLGPGPQVALWDGTDQRGGAVASGVYLARLEARNVDAVQRLVLLR